MSSVRRWLGVAIVGLFGLAHLECGTDTGGSGVPSPPSVGDASPITSNPDGGYIDPGMDASAEDGRPERCEMPAALPPITPAAKGCVAREGTNCQPDWWFCMSKWSPFYYDGEVYRQVPSTPGKREPRQLVWTARFMLDKYPVTNEKYLAYMQETGRAAPPDVLDDAFPNDYTNVGSEPQPTGWLKGLPAEKRLQHPVVGLSRAEAELYCEHRGGHLPSVVEILRAGQYDAPLTYRFPWGAGFPFDPPGSPNVADGFTDKVIGGEYPLHSAVDTIVNDRAPYRTMGLATNVAEWLSTCEEEVRDKFAGNAPLIFVPAPFSATCKDAVLTTNFPRLAPHFMGQRILALQDERDATTTHYLGVRLGTTNSPSLELYRLFYHLPSRPPPEDRAGNNIRNFRIGFRCAYEAP